MNGVWPEPMIFSNKLPLILFTNKITSQYIVSSLLIYLTSIEYITRYEYLNPHSYLVDVLTARL